MPESDFALNCPVPLGRNETIQLAHGGGGRRMRELIEGLFIPAFRSAPLEARHDSAVVSLGGARLALLEQRQCPERNASRVVAGKLSNDS